MAYDNRITCLFRDAFGERKLVSHGLTAGLSIQKDIASKYLSSNRGPGFRNGAFARRHAGRNARSVTVQAVVASR